MYAVIRSGSKQYRVKKGDVIEVDQLSAEPGAQVEFRDVLLLGEGEKVQVGTPTVAKSMVVGKFLKATLGQKIQSIKYKRRKNAYRKFGHRQQYSQVEITDIIG